MATEKSSSTAKRKRRGPKRNVRQIVIMVLVGLALIAFVLPDIMPFIGGGPTTARNIDPSTPNPAAMKEPVFSKEGVLSITSAETGEAIKTIDIEKADNNDERMFGMMFRKSMPDEQGMLFLFDQSTPQSFWMKNTFIPLDIIFIDENFKITSISENAQPHTETPRLSKGPAKYVLEVNGGWCKKYGVKVGDVVAW